jgi:hypothetical protein
MVMAALMETIWWPIHMERAIVPLHILTEHFAAWKGFDIVLFLRGLREEKISG